MSGQPPNWDDIFKRLQRAIPPIPEIKIPDVKIPQEAIDAATAWTRRLDRIERQIANVALPAIEAWQLKMPDLTRWAEIADAVAAAAHIWREEYLAALPPNWRDLNDESLAFAIVERIQATKVCLVWLPRADVLQMVMDARVEDVPQVLVGHKDEVLEDAGHLLDDVQATDFARERDAAREAINAFRVGHHRAAQALAATAFTSTCHVWFATGGTGQIAETMRAAQDRAGVSQLRIISIFEAAEPALRAFNPLHAKPKFRFFNRHNSAHRITDEQFTEANALAAIMLLAALLRELEQWPLTRDGDAPDDSA